MPTAEASEAEWPLGGATMPHSVSDARRRYHPSNALRSAILYRLGWGHSRTGVLMESEIGTSTRSDKSRNRHFGGCPSLGLSAKMSDATRSLRVRVCDEGPVDLSRAFVVIGKGLG